MKLLWGKKVLWKSKPHHTVRATLMQQRNKVEAYETLKREGLPIPPDLKFEIESQKGTDDPRS